MTEPCDPDECAATTGHHRQWDDVVMDTAPPIESQHCTGCSAYRTRGGFGVGDPSVWSDPQVHPRFSTSDG